MSEPLSSPVYKDDFFTNEEIIQEIKDAEEEGTFAEQLQAFYDNECDELHDSSGDPEYQQGVIGRMLACTRVAMEMGIDIQLMSHEEMDAETPLYNK